MKYAVMTLRDHDLPAGQDWCIVREPGQITACIKRSRASDARVLAEAWAATRQAERRLLQDALAERGPLLEHQSGGIGGDHLGIWQ